MAARLPCRGPALCDAAGAVQGSRVHPGGSSSSDRLAVLRLDGDGLEAPIKDEKRLDGTLLDVLRQLDESLELNITTAVDFTSSRQEERTADYPLVALQQVARNAVMHRSYEHTASPFSTRRKSSSCGTVQSLARCGRRSDLSSMRRE
jgi:hypothetical protein